MFMSILTEGNIRIGLTIIILIVILLILLKFRATKNSNKTSLDLLKERLEKGEISAEEYEAARKKQIKD